MIVRPSCSRGFPVALNDRTPEVHALPAETVMSANHLAQQLRPTHSLAEAELALSDAGRESEIDYERRKAQSREQESVEDSTATTTGSELVDQLAEIRRDAAARGIDFITLRGLAERLGLPGARLADLRRHLQSRPLGEYVAPLWTVRPHA
jgi:hypothetical protein